MINEIEAIKNHAKEQLNDLMEQTETIQDPEQRKRLDLFLTNQIKSIDKEAIDLQHNISEINALFTDK